MSAGMTLALAFALFVGAVIYDSIPMVVLATAAEVAGLVLLRREK